MDTELLVEIFEFLNYLMIIFAFAAGWFAAKK